jgi:hypothetical protein
MAHHHMKTPGTQPPCSLEHVTDQGLTSQRVQHFGCAGLHAATVSGSQNNDLKHSQAQLSGGKSDAMMKSTAGFASKKRAIAQQTPEIRGIGL